MAIIAKTSKTKNSPVRGRKRSQKKQTKGKYQLNNGFKGTSKASIKQKPKSKFEWLNSFKIKLWAYLN